jgi:hypothetical protein
MAAHEAATLDESVTRVVLVVSPSLSTICAYLGSQPAREQQVPLAPKMAPKSAGGRSAEYSRGRPLPACLQYQPSADVQQVIVEPLRTNKLVSKPNSALLLVGQVRHL